MCVHTVLCLSVQGAVTVLNTASAVLAVHISWGLCNI
jgi:hypothetical protein